MKGIKFVALVAVLGAVLFFGAAQFNQALAVGLCSEVCTSLSDCNRLCQCDPTWAITICEGCELPGNPCGLF